MVTPEERITRLEAMQEANSQLLREILSRQDYSLSHQDHILSAVEAARQEAREMNETTRKETQEMIEAARRETREIIEAARQEAREETRALRQETHQSVEAARRDARNLFIAGIAIVSAWGAGLIGLGIAILQRIPV